MKTRLLGAAVLIALAVLFVPMFFSSTPPAPGGDQAVSLAIPPAPDRDLQTRTMSLAPDAPASGASATTVQTQSVTPASADKLATVDIGSSRPRDVETDPEAGKPAQPTTVTTGSGTSPSQPVIPQRTTPPQAAANTGVAVATKPTVVATPTRPAVAAPSAPASAVAPTAARGSYTLNLSAYASAAGAASLERRVRELGYPVSGHAITQAGKSRTLVIAGPFETRTAAEAARLKITQSIPGVPARLEQDASRESSAAATPPAAATTTARAGGWAVQLAAMGDQADANALRDKLRANGFDGFVDAVQSGGRRLWRVRAGPQTQRDDAQRVHDQIKAKLGIDGNVVPVP
ncbi:SPOR domain-containing protein [Rhodanobacter sp. B2A1Ga4]|uniref:SPOR domain-containing protein n=1 Tax=Rhodanobacter sp. B2A1Ga4 TaxID=2778647 RepID=UPI001B373306|nr:SPOR domain-containing protein [Rhodanobacter sp. B2A1Ga4]MBQ4853363.1 SPOR domain-containing protein [Rhodanobacter sp. B2A1Ga4]